jgi:hypothetical protein
MTQSTQATLRYKNVEIVEEVEKMERLKKQSYTVNSSGHYKQNHTRIRK